MSEGGADERTTDQIKPASDNLDPPSFRFLLPKWPPSVNSLYNVIFSQRRVELKPEVRLWKTQAKELIPLWKDLKDTKSLLSVELDFYGAWWHANGNLKKTDVQNMVKVTLDALAEKNGFDDSRVFECVERKRASLKEYVEGTVKLLGNSGRGQSQPT